MHEIIQILFDWDGYHMHDFRIPSDDILIEQDTGEDNFWNYGGYNENETLVDPFFRKYKWIRYTYDFGDDWRHKIMIEKIDETYQECDVILMKYKGDNFAEDSGGIYFADESSCFAFDPDETIQKKASPMTKKVDAWKKFCEDAKLEKLKLSEPKYTQRELLQALDNQEASDYSCGEIRKSSWQKNAVAAALMVGLCDFQEKADAGELSFALDIKPLLKK